MRIPLLQPKISTVECEGHTVQVSAYSSDSVSITLNLQEINKIKYKIDQAVGMVLPGVSFEGPSGSLTFENAWEECPTSHKAYWTFDFEAGLDPVFGANVKVPIGPAPPRWITKWVEASIYVKFSGKATIKGKMVRNNYGVVTGSIPMEGKVNGELGVSCLLLGPKVLSFIANGGTGITATGNFAVDTTGVYMKEAKVAWDGINAKVTIIAAWGIIEIDRTWEIAPPKKIIGPKDFTLYIP